MDEANKQEKAVGADITTIHSDGESTEELMPLSTLLEHREGINSQGEYGRTPLMRACEERNMAIAISLIKHGANLDIRDSINRQALEHALEQKCWTSVIELMLERGAKWDVVTHNVGYGDANLFMFACYKSPEYVIVLIKHWAKLYLKQHFPDSCDEDNDATCESIMNFITDLCSSSSNAKEEQNSNSKVGDDNNLQQKKEVSEHINGFMNQLRERVNLTYGTASYGGNTWPSSALFKAIHANHLDIAKLLVKLGADLKVSTGMMTPLMVACYQKCVETVDWLVNEMHVDIHCLTSDRERNAFIYACTDAFDSEPALKCVAILLNAGADIDYIGDGKKSKSALMEALENDTLCKWLLKHGANMNLQNNSGETALMESAVALDYDGMLGYLNKDNPFFQPRHRCTDILIKAGADLYLTNSKGKTAFMIARDDKCANSLHHLAPAMGIDLKDIDYRTNYYDYM